MDKKIICTGKAFDPETRDWTMPVTYEAKDRMDAINWCRFQRNWFKDLRIDGVPA